MIEVPRRPPARWWNGNPRGASVQPQLPPFRSLARRKVAGFIRCSAVDPGWPTSELRVRSSGRGFLVPDFNPISVHIAGEQIRLPGNELSALEHLAAGVPNGIRGTLDVLRIRHAEPEMRDALPLADSHPL